MKISLTKIIAHTITSLGLTAVFTLPMNASYAIEVYKYTGSHGEVKYAQYPPRGIKNVDVIVFSSDGRQVDSGKMAGKTDPNEESKQMTAEEQRIAQLEERIKEQEKQAKARKCQSLQNNLTNLGTGGRLYQLDENGNRKYLDDREIEMKRQNIQQAINQLNCNGQTT